MKTNTPIEKLAEVQKALKDAKQALESIEWSEAMFAERDLGEHLSAVTRHIDNAIGRASTLACEVKRLNGLNLYKFTYYGKVDYVFQAFDTGALLIQEQRRDAHGEAPVIEKWHVGESRWMQYFPTSQIWG